MTWVCEEQLGIRFDTCCAVHFVETLSQRLNEAALLGDQPVDGLLYAKDRPDAAARLAGDDERRAPVIDQRMVGLVDDGDLEIALYPVAPRVAQVVAQVVETELSEGAVDDIVAIGAPPFRVAHVTQDDADRQTQELVCRGEELGIAQCKVVVRSDDVNAASGERLRDGGKGRSDRLSLARVHLDDGAIKHQPSRLYLLVGRLEPQGVGKRRFPYRPVEL